MQKFIFPLDTRDYKKVGSILHLQTILQSDLLQFGHLQYTLQKQYHKKTQTYAIYAKCDKCFAYLWFKSNKNDGYFYLCKFQTQHIHTYKAIKQLDDPFIVKEKIRVNELYQDEITLKNYSKYYRCLYINYCKNMKDKLLSFSGLDNKSNIKIFGLCIFSLPTKPRITYCIKQFFEKKKFLPQTIIISNPEIGSCLKKNYKGTVISFPEMDIGHFRLKETISELLKATTEEEWLYIRRQKIINSKQLQTVYPLSTLTKIIDTYKYLSLLHLPQTFVHVGIQLQHNLFIQHEFEECLFTYGVSSLDELLLFFAKTIPTKMSAMKVRDDLQKLLKFHEASLNSIEAFLSDPAILFLFKQIYKTYFYQLTMGMQSSYIIKRQFSDESWVVLQESEELICECDIECKTGLPCSHMLKVLLYLGKNLRRHINDYWIISLQS